MIKGFSIGLGICLFSFTTAVVLATDMPLARLASMVASPNSCQLEPLDEMCEMQFHLIWETPKLGNYCLYRQQDGTPLHCWQHTNHGNIELEFSGHILENHKTYLLFDQDTAQLMTSVVVPISGTLKQRQRAQRRRRGFWRMF
jgi:hypothetical protein